MASDTNSHGMPRRLFTALFPNAAASAAIDAERRRWRDLPRTLRPVPERMHVTLQFFDQVDAERERAWQGALAGLRFAPFDVVLDRAEIWRAPRGSIAVLRPAANAALDGLHAITDELARRAGLVPERRRFKPHLTALRHAEKTTLTPLERPIVWRAERVDLIWSDLQAQPPRYRVLGRFGAADLRPA